MGNNENLRREFIGVLEDCVAGRRTMLDYLGWEVRYALDDWIDDDLAGEMSRLASLADELDFAHMDERIFLDDVREALIRLRIEWAPLLDGSSGSRAAPIAAD